MSAPLSVRFPPGVLDRLRRRAQSIPGSTPSGLAIRLVEEGLRQVEHPGIVFKDGPTGRRAALAFGPDVWEVVKALREFDERGPAAISGTADLLGLTDPAVRIALAYYSDHPEEIDAEIAAADEASERAERAWLSEQRLLA